MYEVQITLKGLKDFDTEEVTLDFLTETEDQADDIISAIADMFEFVAPMQCIVGGYVREKDVDEESSKNHS